MRNFIPLDGWGLRSINLRDLFGGNDITVYYNIARSFNAFFWRLGMRFRHGMASW